MEVKKTSLKDLSKSDIEVAFNQTVSEVSISPGRLELVNPDRYEAVYELAKECFLEDEPLEKAVGMTWTAETEQMWHQVLGQNLSIVLVNEDSGELMGMRAIKVTSKHDHVNVDSIKDDALKKLIAFLQHCADAFDVHEKYNLKEIFEFFGLGVAKKYRRQGIGTFLIDVSVKFLRNLNVGPCLIKTSASSNYSKKIFEKYGFCFLVEFPFDRYSVDGEVVFKNTGEHKSVKVYKMCL